MTNRFANHFLEKLETTCCVECKVNETCHVKLPQTECFLHSAKFSDLLSLYADKVKPETVADIQFQYQLKELKELQPTLQAIAALTAENHDVFVSQDEIIQMKLEQHKQIAFEIERFEDDFKGTYETMMCATTCWMNNLDKDPFVQKLAEEHKIPLSFYKGDTESPCGHSPDINDRDGCIRFKSKYGEPLLIADFKLNENGLVWIRSFGN